MELYINTPQRHFFRTRDLALSLDRLKLANWFLYDGYYPEQYILPPKFKVKKFDFKGSPNYNVSDNGKTYNPNIFTPLTISFPKSTFAVREFGIIHPKIYHDFVWHIVKNWDIIIEHLFSKETIVFCYSFPVPVTKKKKGHLGCLRAGRMIYEYLEMVENDLITESYKYKYIVKTDISNFYSSVYTHSLSWALHGKEFIRRKENRNNYKFIGNILDKLSQGANDGCTNGLIIGPVISDLLSEIILSGSDKQFSKEIVKENIDVSCVRFKDDYRFLCKTEDEAKYILTILQKVLSCYNLSINEGKTTIQEIPSGLYHDWKLKYQPYSLVKKSMINFKTFQEVYFNVLQIDKMYPNTGLIDKFISELSNTKSMTTKLDLNFKETIKVMGLLLLLKQRRAKSFPSILAAIESIVNAKAEGTLHNIVKNMLFEIKMTDDYDLVWVLFFVIYTLKIEYPFKNISKNLFLKTLQKNKQLFFVDDNDVILYDNTNKENNYNSLLYHLSVFNKQLKR